MQPTDHSFSLQIQSVDIVPNLLSKSDEKKATGLDMIPSKLLKMAVFSFLLAGFTIFVLFAILVITATLQETTFVIQF